MFEPTTGFDIDSRNNELSSRSISADGSVSQNHLPDWVFITTDISRDGGQGLLGSQSSSKSEKTHYSRNRSLVKPNRRQISAGRKSRACWACLMAKVTVSFDLPAFYAIRSNSNPQCSPGEPCLRCLNESPSPLTHLLCSRSHLATLTEVFFPGRACYRPQETTFNS